jgi:hypothetical protein
MYWDIYLLPKRLFDTCLTKRPDCIEPDWRVMRQTDYPELELGCGWNSGDGMILYLDDPRLASPLLIEARARLCRLQARVGSRETARLSTRLFF